MKTKRRKLKKAIPYCFQQKKSASLSQILNIGSYKKRITDLLRNNRRLAVELQEARCETASLNKIITDFARDCNNIMVARMKIKEMAKELLTQFVNYIDGVLSHLDVNCTGLKDKLVKKRFTPYGKVVKEPNLKGIEEMSDDEGLSPKPNTEHQILPQISSFDKKKKNNILKSNSLDETENKIMDTTVLPILFVEERNNDEDTTKENAKSSTNEGSLTPVLDIDLTYLKRKKSSSRRQTMFLTPNRKTGSREKLSEQEECNHIQYEKSPIITSEIQQNDILTSCCTKNLKQSRSKKNVHDSSPELLYNQKKSDGTGDLNSSHTTATDLKDTSFAPPKTDILPQAIISNNTLHLCEDMELTDVVSTARTILVGNNENTVGNDSEIRFNAAMCVETSDITKEKEYDISEETEITALNKSISDLTEESELQKNAVVQNKKSVAVCKPATSSKVTTRHKTVTYSEFFSDDSGDGWTPIRGTPKRKKNQMRDTVIFVSDSVSKPNIENGINFEKHSAKSENVTSNDASVFSFNASHSEESVEDAEGKKHKSKLSRNKQNTKKKVIAAKPLLTNCSVSKKGFQIAYKKIDHGGVNKLSKNILQGKKSKSDLNVNACVSIDFIRRKENFPSQENVNRETSKNSEESSIKNSLKSDNLFNSSLMEADSFYSPRTILKKRNSENQRSDVKRVSFNSTDLICNFKRMSQSKTIAENTKVWQASKSIVHLSENQELPHLNMIHSTENLPNLPKTKLLHNYSEETEIYNLSDSLDNVRSCPKTNDLPDETAKVLPLSLDDIRYSFAITKNPSSPRIIPSSDRQQYNKSSSSKKKQNFNKIDSSKLNNEIEEDVLCRKEVLKKISSIGKKNLGSKNSVLKVKRKSHIKSWAKSSKENINSSPQIKSPKGIKIRKSKSLEALNNNNCSNEFITHGNNENNAIFKMSLEMSKVKKRKMSKSSSAKKMKNSCNAEFVESSPMLVNVTSQECLDIPESSTGEMHNEECLELPKRRSRQKINYKEPTLRTKMRRDT